MRFRMKLKYLVLPVIVAIAIVSVALTSSVNAGAASWYTKLVVNSNKVSSCLNVRKSADSSSQIVGKISAGGSAEIIQVGKTWTLIKIGNGKGYVKNEYCLFGDSAKKIIESGSSTSTTKATTTSSSSSSGTDSNALMKAQVQAYNEAIKQGMSEKQAKSYALKNAKVTSTSSSSSSSSSSDSASIMKAQVLAYNEAIKQGMSEKEATAYAVKNAKVTTSTTSDTSTASTSTSTETASTSADDDTVKLMAAIIMCEAGGESYEGQLAVGAVVMNRVASSKFPNTVKGVIYQKSQFTPASTGKLARTLESGNITSSCYTAARAALAGQDNTGGCLYFHAGGGSGLTIGNQTFY